MTNQILQVRSKSDGALLAEFTVWELLLQSLGFARRLVDGQVSVTVGDDEVVRDVSPERVRSRTAPAALPSGTMTMVDALRYIHQDPRFYARPKDTGSYVVRWDGMDWQYVRTPLPNMTTPLLPLPAVLLGEWEIVHPEGDA